DGPAAAAAGPDLAGAGRRPLQRPLPDLPRPATAPPGLARLPGPLAGTAAGRGPPGRRSLLRPAPGREPPGRRRRLRLGGGSAPGSPGARAGSRRALPGPGRPLRGPRPGGRRVEAGGGRRRLGTALPPPAAAASPGVGTDGAGHCGGGPGRPRGLPVSHLLYLLAVTTPSPSPSPVSPFGPTIIHFNFLLSTLIWTPVLMATVLAVLPNPRRRYDRTLYQAAFWTNAALLFLCLVAYNQANLFSSAQQFE